MCVCQESLKCSLEGASAEHLTWEPRLQKQTGQGFPLSETNYLNFCSISPKKPWWVAVTDRTLLKGEVEGKLEGEVWGFNIGFEVMACHPKGSRVDSSRQETADTDSTWMGFRTCYPKAQDLGRVNILSWRNLRNSAGKDSLTFSWSHPQTLLCKGTLSPHPEERSILISQVRDTETNRNKQDPLSFPQFTTHTLFPWGSVFH